MKLTLQGVVWDCPSPSFLQLSKQHYVVDGDVTLDYLGDIWLLTTVNDDGSVRTGYYQTRDDGIAFVARALSEAGIVANCC